MAFSPRAAFLVNNWHTNKRETCFQKFFLFEPQFLGSVFLYTKTSKVLFKNVRLQWCQDRQNNTPQDMLSQVLSNVFAQNASF